MAYIGTSPSNGVRRRFTYEATASQTSFSGNDENGITLTYVDSLYLDVYQNGVKLKAGDDYTATTGTSVVLAVGASANDVVEMVAFDVFSVNDSVSASAGGSFAGNIGMGGTLAVTGVPTFTGRSVHSGGITVANAGQIGSVGDADAMAISSSGVVTFSQTPVFSSGGGGSVEKLSTVTTTGVSAVDFDSSLITDTFMTYRIIGSNFRVVTSNATPQLQLSIDNGSNFNLNVRGAKLHQRLYQQQVYNSIYYGGDGSVHQLANNTSGTTTELAAFDATIFNTRGTTGIKYVTSDYIGELHGDADAYLWMGASRVNVVSAINLLRVSSSSGNVAGTFTLYGIRA